MKRRSVVLSVLVCAISLTISALAAELVARVAFPDWAPRTGRLAAFWQHDPVYGWSHLPSSSGEFSSWGFTTKVRINSHGFRGPDISFESHDASNRVVVLGDSFVWGFGVEEDECFTSVLQDQLGPENEVINLGVSGYSTDQELLVYRNIGRKYQPKTVVLTIASNDFANNVLTTAYVIYGKPVFRLVDGDLVLRNQPVPKPSLLERAVFAAASGSYLLNQLNRLRESSRIATTAVESNSRPAVRDFPNNEAERITLRLITELRDDVEADNARFIAFLVDRIYGDHNFRRALDTAGIEYIAMDDHLPDAQQDIHLDDDLHWNAKGHRIVATALASALRENPESVAGPRGTSPFDGEPSGLEDQR